MVFCAEMDDGAVWQPPLAGIRPLREYHRNSPGLFNEVHFLNSLSDLSGGGHILRVNFERKPAHEMAQTLGLSDDAAQKRVSRAVQPCAIP
jgi:hypothetical protein